MREAFNPTNNNECYVTTEDQGLWVSENIGGASPTFSLVDSYPFAHPIRCFFNPEATSQLWVASFGDGLRMADLSGNSGAPETAAHAPVALSVYPVPARDRITLVLRRPGIGPVTVRVFDASGREVLGRRLAGLSGEITASLDVRGLAPGVYYVRAVSGALVTVGRITVVR